MAEAFDQCAGAALFAIGGFAGWGDEAVRAMYYMTVL